MAGCVLRVQSTMFDSDQFLSKSGWVSETSWSDGFNMLISGAEGFGEQLAEAVKFVSANEAALKDLHSQTGGKAAELDFGLFMPEAPMSSVSVPADAMRAFSEVGLCLRVSTYVPSAT